MPNFKTTPMRQTITTLILLLLTVFAFGQQTEKALTYFDYDKYELTQQSKATLDNLLEKVKSKDIIQIEVYGHTDNDGDESYNKKLSQNRATTVRQYLVSKGISNDKIKIEYFGEAQPTATNDNEDGKQKNRRVEIVIKYKDKVEIVKSNPSDTVKKKIEIIEPKQNPTRNGDLQVFTNSPKKEIVIKGKKGSVITFSKNSFVDKNGKLVTTDVTIELIEIYTKSDMINHNIQTMSNGKLLETGGMVYINATSQNSKVYLDKNSYYQIEFPTKNKKSDMGIFHGDTTNHNINWQQASSNFRSDMAYIENQKELNKYIFNSTELGWINCDRFQNVTNKTDLFVNLADTNGVSFCLVFKNINAVMNISSKDKGIEFSNVPVGETATIVAFKKNSSETFFASKTITIQKKQTETLTLEKMTDKEFQERIKQFD